MTTFLVIVSAPSARTLVRIVAASETLGAVATIAALVALSPTGAHAVAGTRLAAMKALHMGRVTVCAHASEPALLVRLRRGKAGLRRAVIRGGTGAGSSRKRGARPASGLGIAKRLEVVGSCRSTAGLRAGRVEWLCGL